MLRALFAIPFILSVVLGGCRSAPAPVAYARQYPMEAVRNPVTQNIQVFRRGTSLELTNTTARPFGPGTLWLNRRFSLPVEKFEIGDKLTFSLFDFRDEFSDSFRGGGFFASEAPDTLVLAEWEAPAATPGQRGELVELIVVKGAPD